MPLQTPSEPKKYTTVYGDFRGVDFTNDQTNVWKRRSPTGLNMMPDESGRPWKRTGWDIELKREEFISIYCYKNGLDSYDGYFAIFKVFNFSLNGNDYMIIFTNIGVFSYTDYGINYLRESGDPTRSFFFESGAVAGFYIFDGYKLFRFDGYLLVEINPYVPTVLISRAPSGGGEMYEALNLINNRRTDSFLGDSTSKTYYTSAAITDVDSVVVKVMNSSGAYEKLTSGYTVSSTGVTFSEAKPPIKEGEDNVQITYSTTSITQESEEIESVVRKVIHPEDASLMGSYNGKVTNRVWLKGRDIVYTNGKPNITVYVRNAQNEWIVLNEKYYEIKHMSYGDAYVEVLYNGADFPGKYIQSNNLLTYQVKVKLQYRVFSTNRALMAFASCKSCAVYGTGLINSVFIGGSDYANYSSRVWYSKVGDPTYFPDTNYIEAGSTDTQIMGLVKVGEYLGIIKEADTADSTIYLAYPVSFDEDTTYAVKQSVNGIGAVSRNCFDILNDETLFFSRDGIMAIEPSDNENDRCVKNRSYYINSKLLSEADLYSAFSYVWNGFYILCVNDHCYILDGTQKSSWVNERTNMQYECYYWDNIPATCFAHYEGSLWFSDKSGNMCRIKDRAKDGDNAFNDDGDPISCEWSTPLDNDGITNYFKNLQKKGCLVTILPMSNTGADIYVRADDKEPIFIGRISAENPTVPQEFYLNKKIKKYKRLQIIAKNNTLNQGFGLQEIIKVYTIGNYSKNRSGNNGT